MVQIHQSFRDDLHFHHQVYDMTPHSVCPLIYQHMAGHIVGHEAVGLLNRFKRLQCQIRLSMGGWRFYANSNPAAHAQIHDLSNDNQGTLMPEAATSIVT
jgi:hypothetical protein